MLSFTFALAAAASWGLADFAGGALSRDRRAVDVVLRAQTAAILAVIALIGLGALSAPRSIILPAVLSGVSSGCAVVLLYRALAIGPMGVVAPIFALSAAIPVVVGFATGDRISALQTFGMAAALGGCARAARAPESARRPRLTGIFLAAAAAMFIGAGLVGLHAGARTNSDWALEESRASEFLTVLAIALMSETRGFLRRMRPGITLAAVGVLDLAASFFFARASVSGALAVVSVLASVYPALTAFLAWMFLHERMQLAQRLGVAAAFAGIVLLITG